MIKQNRTLEQNRERQWRRENIKQVDRELAAKNFEVNCLSM